MTAIPGDDPKFRGKPDSTLLNRDEEYEVLAFIKRFAQENNFKDKAFGLKTEKLIKEKLPPDIRSHANVKLWLKKNWENY